MSDNYYNESIDQSITKKINEKKRLNNEELGHFFENCTDISREIVARYIEKCQEKNIELAAIIYEKLLISSMQKIDNEKVSKVIYSVSEKNARKDDNEEEFSL